MALKLHSSSSASLRKSRNPLLPLVDWRIQAVQSQRQPDILVEIAPPSMAILAPPGTGISARFSSPATARVSRRFTAFASLSTPQKDTLDWVEATSSFFQEDSRPIMLFDGVCNLCNGGVRFVRANDRKRNIRFEALQSEAGKNLLRRSGRAPDDISSVVLVEKERSYIKSDAVLKIMQYIDLPFPQLAFFFQFIPGFLRDFAYDNVANNRYAFFGRSDSCEI